MRRFIVMLVLMGVLAAPAAGQDATLPYSLTFSGTPAQGTITGAWGGMLVQGSYAAGRWLLVSGGRPVVGGTYRCDSGCTFDGVLVYGHATNFRLDVPALQATGTGSVDGSLPINLTPPTLP